MTNQCTCGRPVNAGWSAGNNGNNHRCLICRTAQIMATFRDPMTVKYQKQARRKKARNVR